MRTGPAADIIVRPLQTAILLAERGLIGPEALAVINRVTAEGLDMPLPEVAPHE